MAANENLHQYEPLRVPKSWGPEEKKFIQQLTDTLDDIYKRYGRLRIEDLGTALRGRIEDSEGNLATLTQTAELLQSDITDIKGNYSTIAQTASEISMAGPSALSGFNNLIVGTSSAYRDAGFVAADYFEVVAPTALSGFSLEPSDQITVRVHINNTTAEAASLKVTEFDASDAVLANSSGTGVASMDDDYSTVTLTLNASTAKLRIGLQLADAVTDALEYKELKMEKGSTATGWVPHPTDPAAGVLTDGVTINQSGVYVNGTGEVVIASGGKLELASADDLIISSGTSIGTYVAGEIEDVTDPLDTRLIAAETGVSQNASNITLKANTTTVDALTNRVTEAEASIGVNANAITLKVSKNSVISEINQTAEEIKIQAAKVNLVGAVTATELAAGAVTTEKLAANAVTAAKITAATITATQLAAGAVTTDKLAATAVTAEKLAASAIIADKIASGAVTTAKLAASAVTADKIAAGTITADKIAAAAITGAEIAAGTIEAGNIKAGAITTSLIAAAAKTDIVNTAAGTVNTAGVTTSKIALTSSGISIASGGVLNVTAPDSLSITAGSGASSVGVSNGSYFLWAGSATPSSAPFRVTMSGQLYAVNIHQEYGMSFWDMADASYPAEFPLYIPSGYSIDSVGFIFQCKKARTFAKSALSGGGATTTNNGATTPTTSTTPSQTSSTKPSYERTSGYSSGSTGEPNITYPYTYDRYIISNHRHSAGTHTHGYTVDAHDHTIPSHNHEVTISSHNHSVGNHAHSIDYGINENAAATVCVLKVGSTTVGTYSPHPASPVELKTRLSVGSWNTIIVTPNDDARIVAYAMVKLTAL